MCNKGGGDHQSCCEKCKDCCGRIPIVSMIAACIMVASFTMLAVCVELGLKPLDDAFKIIKVYDGVYEKDRTMIAGVMRTACYAFYGFVGVFLAVAFCSSGKNRNCLAGHLRCCKCSRSSVLCLIVLIIIIMAILYFVTLLSVALVGIPLTLASLATNSCKMVTDAANNIPCLSPEFLGSNVNNICRDTITGAKELNAFCDNMDKVVMYAWCCFAALLLSNIGMVIGLTAFGANYAYVKTEGKNSGGKPSKDEV